jgi:hypothetical protein
VLLGYAAGTSITELQRQLGFSRPMIYRCVDKALAAGVQRGLKDKYQCPHEPEITDEAKAWVVSVACTKPKDHGLAAELWSISALAKFVREGAQAAGFPPPGQRQQEHRMAHPRRQRHQATQDPLLLGKARPGLRPQDAGGIDGVPGCLDLQRRRRA